MEAISTDVLPVGAGAAGIRAALAVFGGGVYDPTFRSG